MRQFERHAEYSLPELLQRLEASPTTSLSGQWATKYFTHGDKLILVAKVAIGPVDLRTAENRYDVARGHMQFYGKPHSHSQQTEFLKLSRGELSLEVFALWKAGHDRFMYLGSPAIVRWLDNVEIEQGIKSIMLELSFLEASDHEIDGGPEGTQQSEDGLSAREGKQLTVLVNRYERDPSLRSACLQFFGPTCRICDFDFQAKYGELGRDFCHVHHVKPLAEVGEDHAVDPTTDLIPVCANCHAMLHRRSPALHPDQLKVLLKIG